MKTFLIIAALLLSLTTLPAFAAKSCDELKSEIAAKLDTKGVSGYVLEVVAADASDPRRTVGSCNGASQRIVYARSAAK